MIESFDEEQSKVKYEITRDGKVHREYQAQLSDDIIKIREEIQGGDGLIAAREIPLTHSVGSGVRGRSYLVDRGGVFVMAPLTWYTESQEWDLSPGYERNDLNFNRRIIDGCLSCHAGRTANVVDAEDKYHDPPFLEESIGCERCHGPGKDHIAFHDGILKSQEVDPIVNPVDLSPQLRDDVCFQCHLVGEHRLTRYGRSDFDFRPGDSLDDVWTILVKKDVGINDDSQTTSAVNQAEQMLSSRCYLRSEGALGCISCHDPHKTPPDGQKIDFYREKCLKCHSPPKQECAKPVEERLQQSQQDSCIQCHMPSLEADDVAHVSQTDHRILRTPASQPRQGELNFAMEIFRRNETKTPPEELKRAEAIALALAAEQLGDGSIAKDSIPILEEWCSNVPDDIDAKLVLGQAYNLLESPQDALQVWEDALKDDANNEYLLRRLMVLCQENNLAQDGVNYGERLVKINPWDYEYFGRLSHLYGTVGEVEKSIEAAETALELYPAHAFIHQWLSSLYRSQGNEEKSRFHAEKSRQLQGK